MGTAQKSAPERKDQHSGAKVESDRLTVVLSRQQWLTVLSGLSIAGRQASQAGEWPQRLQFTELSSHLCEVTGIAPAAAESPPMAKAAGAR